MTRLKRKISVKKILSLVLTIAIALGAIGGVVALVKNDNKKIGASAFTRGGLDENGKYVESNVSIYTEEAFYCKGLRIEPDFEFSGTFDVYYYTNDNEFIEAKTGMSAVYDEDYPLAVKARIVIHADTELTKDKDFKIRFYEVPKYANELKITVNKDQELASVISPNLYREDDTVEGKAFYPFANEDWNINTLEDASNGLVSNLITLNDEYDYIEVYYFVPENLYRSVFVCFADETGGYVHSVYGNTAYEEQADYVVGKWVCERIDLRDAKLENAASMRIVTPKNATVY